MDEIYILLNKNAKNQNLRIRPWPCRSLR